MPRFTEPVAAVFVLAQLRSFAIALALLLVLARPGAARAGDMDPSLSRLAVAPGNGPCAGSASYCADNGAFEHLASELAVALSPIVTTPAASGGARGFYLGLSSTLTPIRSAERYWRRGTRGSDPVAENNDDVSSVLTFNRLSVRKGLPFGLEIGSSLGYGSGTSLWVLSGELRVVLFEGFRSGLGALPDVALRGATEVMFGSSDMTLHTHALDVTLSKPFVIGRSHRLTPLLALQALFVNVRSGRIDLTPWIDAWKECAADPTQQLRCAGDRGDLTNDVTFRSIHRTRVRLFLGAEERYSYLSIAATLGIDLAVPQLQTDVMQDDLPDHVMRQVSFHLACGLRY